MEDFVGARQRELPRRNCAHVVIRKPIVFSGCANALSDMRNRWHRFPVRSKSQKMTLSDGTEARLHAVRQVRRSVIDLLRQGVDIYPRIDINVPKSIVQAEVRLDLSAEIDINDSKAIAGLASGLNDLESIRNRPEPDRSRFKDIPCKRASSFLSDNERLFGSPHFKMQSGFLWQ